MTAEELIEAASKVAGVFTPSEDCTVGGVAAALVTAAGNVYPARVEARFIALGLFAPLAT